MQDSIIAMEQVNITCNENQPTVIVALDLSNTFYLINCDSGEILLQNDIDSKPTCSFTYCDILRILTSSNREYFACAKWNSHTNYVEIKSINRLEQQMVIEVDSHVNDIVELQTTSKNSLLNGCLAIG